MTIQQHNAETGTLVRHHEFDFDLAAIIARRNGNLTPHQVTEALASGRRIYTSFNYYQRG